MLIEMLSFALLLFAYPAVESAEFCNMYENGELFATDTRNQYSLLFNIMQQDTQEDRLVTHFLQAFPDAEFMRGGVDEPSYVRMHAEYSIKNDNMSASLFLFFIPCFYHPYSSGFEFYDKANNIEINVINHYETETHQTLDGDAMLEAIQDSSLYKTHQKWMNNKNQTVYVFPESVDVLDKRGYLAEQLTFFDLKK